MTKLDVENGWWSGYFMSVLGKIQTIDSLKIRGYRMLFIGMLGQWAVWSLQQIAQSLLLYRLTGSAALLGIMALVNAVPTLALSLYAGVLADRFPKKYIILVAQGISAFAMIFVAGALSFGYLSPQHSGSWWILMVSTVFQSISMAIMLPARNAVMVELVGREKLMNASAVNTIGISLFQVIMPVVGGVIIDAIDFAPVYYIMFGLFIWGIIFTSFVPVTRPAKKLQSQNMLSNINDGLKYTWHNSSILFVIVFALVCMILTSPQMTMMAIFADSILKVGATGMGVLQTISGISALVISLVLATLPSKRRGLLLIISGLVSGLALVVFAFSRSMVLSSVIMAITGMAATVNMLCTLTLLQVYTDEVYLGRVLSIQNLGMGLGGLGGFMSGIIAEHIGVQWSMGGFAVVLVLLSVLLFFARPKIRRLA